MATSEDNEILRAHSSETARPRPAGRWRPVVAAVMCGAALAACGSAAANHSSGATGGPLLAYAQCMRAHGVPDFPDPSPAGGLAIPNDIDTASPAFRSAQGACGTPGPAGAGSPRLAASRKLQLLTLARCMRSHGVSGFADPTSTPPPPSGGVAIGGQGWYLALGSARERQSPAYRRAAAACGAQRF